MSVRLCALRKLTATPRKRPVPSACAGSSNRRFSESAGAAAAIAPQQPSQHVAAAELQRPSAAARCGEQLSFAASGTLHTCAVGAGAEAAEQRV
eukprot:scaffold350_cov313-Prasinococcus_capsulatus_cf.AAC.7